MSGIETLSLTRSLQSSARACFPRHVDGTNRSWLSRPGRLMELYLSKTIFRWFIGLIPLPTSTSSKLRRDYLRTTHNYKQGYPISVLKLEMSNKENYRLLLKHLYMAANETFLRLKKGNNKEHISFYYFLYFQKNRAFSLDYLCTALHLILEQY